MHRKYVYYIITLRKEVDDYHKQDVQTQPIKMYLTLCKLLDYLF